MKTKCVKKASLLTVTLTIMLVGIMTVCASTATSDLVSLYMSSHNIVMSDLTGDYHQGLAKAVNKPSNAMTISWKLYKVSLFSESLIGSGSMSQLDDMIWHQTGVVKNTADGKYKHNFYSNGTYYGNVEGFNY